MLRKAFMLSIFLEIFRLIRFIGYPLCLSFILSCSNQPEPIFRVATNVWPGYESLYLARSLGLYEQSPIRLVEMTSASQVSHAIRNGTVEAAALTLDETVSLLQDHKVDVRVVLIMDISDGADALLARPHITDLKELQGKRIGVENTATGALVLDAALQKAGLLAKDVRIIPMTVNNHKIAWQKNEVDAVVTFEPVRSALLDAGAHQLFDSSQIPGRILDVLVIRADAMPTHAATIKTLIAGHFAALNYLAQNPQQAASLMAPRLADDVNRVLPQFKGVKLPDLTENWVWLSGPPDPLLHKSAVDLVKLMRQHQLLEREVNVNGLAESKFLPEPSK